MASRSQKILVVKSNSLIPSALRPKKTIDLEISSLETKQTYNKPGTQLEARRQLNLESRRAIPYCEGTVGTAVNDRGPFLFAGKQRGQAELHIYSLLE